MNRLFALLLLLAPALGLCVDLEQRDEGAASSLPEEEPKESLVVAISPTAPFVMYEQERSEAERQPRGFNIDLWNALAEQLGSETRWSYHDRVDGVFRAVHFGEADAGLVAFPPGALSLGLQVMVLESQSPLHMIKRAAKKFVAELSAEVFIIPLLIFFGAGNVRWVIDRIGPREQRKFPGNYFFGVGEASWWNLCLLLEWEGTGEKTSLARTYDLLWHLGGIVLLSSFIGLLTATLTLESVNEKVEELDDLQGREVALPNEESFEGVLRPLRLGERHAAESLDEAVQQLIDGEISAIIDSSSAIQAKAREINAAGGVQVRVLPELLNEQRYAVVMLPDHPRQADVDRLLSQIDLPRGLQPSLANELAGKWQVSVGLNR